MSISLGVSLPRLTCTRRSEPMSLIPPAIAIAWRAVW